MNIKMAEMLALEKLKKEFPSLDFASRMIRNESAVEITCDDIQLKGHDDLINLSFTLTKGEMIFLNMTFDRIDKTPETLGALNDFNASNALFKAYIHDNGYLVLELNMPVYGANEFGDQAVQFMLRGNDLTNDAAFKKLTSLTYSDKSLS